MFLKKGTPQPIHVASGLCEICKQNPSTCLFEGKMVCQSCKENITNSQTENITSSQTNLTD
jgi:hypothetical protein